MYHWLIFWIMDLHREEGWSWPIMQIFIYIYISGMLFSKRNIWKSLFRTMHMYFPIYSFWPSFFKIFLKCIIKKEDFFQWCTYVIVLMYRFPHQNVMKYTCKFHSLSLLSGGKKHKKNPSGFVFCTNRKFKKRLCLAIPRDICKPAEWKQMAWKYTK